MAANASAVSALPPAWTMTKPSPASPALNSPITAPTEASGMATFSPTKICGSAAGRRIRTNVCPRGVSSDLASSTSSGGVDVSPEATDSTTGKKHTSSAMTTLGCCPKPIHTTSSGASATLGTALKATSSGANISSATRQAAISSPIASPQTTESAKPSTVSVRVIAACSSR